jgi:ABC-type dipeptide/oligopeptide/nickel transport system permease subunit
MRPVILVVSVTGGFTVVISMGAGMMSGYLINHAKRTRSRKTKKIITVPHRIIFRGGLEIISFT